MTEPDSLTPEEQLPEQAEPGLHSGLVLGLFLGLMVLALLAMSPLFMRGGIVDPEELLSDGFQVSAWPAGLQPVAARKLDSGQRVLLVEGPGSEQLDLPPVLEEDLPEQAGENGQDEPSSAGEDDEEEKPDWASFPLSEGASPPVRVRMVWHNPRGHEAMRRSQFENLPSSSLEDLSKKGGRVLRDADELEWDQYMVPYVWIRRFDAPAAVRDQIRVDLSHDKTVCVLYAEWPIGQAADLEQLKLLLAAIETRTIDG